MIQSGVDSINALLEGGLTLGDNIVWVADSADALDALGAAFLAAPGGVRRHLCCGRSATCSRHVGDAVEHAVEHVGDADSLQPADLEQRMLGDDVGPGAWLVLDRIDDLVLRWGAAEAVRFYRSTCPRLFERGATAYWMATPDAGSAVMEGVS